MNTMRLSLSVVFDQQVDAELLQSQLWRVQAELPRRVTVPRLAL